MSEARHDTSTPPLWQPASLVDLAEYRRGQDAIRSLKLLADWLLSQGYERHLGESNAQFVGRMLRDAIGKGEMP